MRSSHSSPAPASCATETKAPRLLDELRARMRRLGLSLRTEEAYVGWWRRFILANGKRHPREMGAREVEAFLSGLAGTEGQANPGITRPSTNHDGHLCAHRNLRLAESSAVRHD